MNVLKPKKHMRHLLRAISAPLFALAFLMLSNGFFLTYVSAKLHLDHYSSYSIGVIQGSYYAGFLIAALKCERLIQRIKHIRAFSFFASIATACTLLTVFADNLLTWMISRFIMGVCIAALYVIIESWLLIISNSKNRGIVLAFYMIALYISQSLSQYLINFIQIESLMAFIISGFLASISILPVTFTHTRIPEMSTPPASAIFKYFIIAPLATVGAIVSGMMLSSIYTFAPNYAQTYNLSIANLMSITIAGGFLLQYPIGHLSDLFDRGKVVVFVALMAMLSSIAMIISTGHSPIWILIFSFIMGGFVFTIYPLSVTQVIDRTHSDAVTTVAGVILFAYSIGAVIGPLVTPIFITALGGEIGLYYSVALSAAILTIVGLFVLKIKKPIPKKDQETFVALPPQTPVAGDLDPRVEENRQPKD